MSTSSIKKIQIFSVHIFKKTYHFNLSNHTQYVMTLHLLDLAPCQKQFLVAVVLFEAS